MRRCWRFAQGDPPARPLGPEALVDIALGMDPRLAAEQEEQGYYVAMSRAPRVTERDARPPKARRPGPTPEGLSPADERPGAEIDEKARILAAFVEHRGDPARVAASLHLSVADLDAKLRTLSLVRRVAALRREMPSGPVPPRVRAGPLPPHQRPALTPPAKLPRRGAGRPPMGRMAQGKPERRGIAELRSPKGREELLQLLRSHPANLGAVLRRLNLSFTSPKGDVDEAELLGLISGHGLKAEVRRLERDHLRDLVVRNRGDLRAVAKALHLARPALVTRLREHGLLQGAETLRGKLRREIRERSFESRVRILLKSASYLEELDALETLTRDLSRELLGRFPDLKDLDAGQRAARVAPGLNLSLELANQLLARLRLDRA